MTTMRRSDFPATVLSFGPDTIETTFPTTGRVAESLLEVTTVEIWPLGQCGGYKSGLDHRIHGCVVPPPRPQPLSYNGNPRHGPVDCDGVGGSFVVPVFHRTYTEHFPIIPIINGAPAVYAAYRRAPLLVYPAFRVDSQGRLAVRWDQQIHALPRARYEARVKIDGLVCGVFEIDKTTDCPLDISAAVSVDLQPLDAALARPIGVSDMFDDIYHWSSVSTCTFGPSDTMLAVKDAKILFATTVCKAPELVITDGVSTEILTLVGCPDDTHLEVERSGRNTIQSGAVVRFEWTANNVLHAAQGC